VARNFNFLTNTSDFCQNSDRQQQISDTKNFDTSHAFLYAASSHSAINADKKV